MAPRQIDIEAAHGDRQWRARLIAVPHNARRLEPSSGHAFETCIRARSLQIVASHCVSSSARPLTVRARLVQPARTARPWLGPALDVSWTRHWHDTKPARCGARDEGGNFADCPRGPPLVRLSTLSGPWSSWVGGSGRAIASLDASMSATTSAAPRPRGALASSTAPSVSRRSSLEGTGAPANLRRAACERCVLLTLEIALARPALTLAPVAGPSTNAARVTRPARAVGVAGSSARMRASTAGGRDVRPTTSRPLRLLSYLPSQVCGHRCAVADARRTVQCHCQIH